MKYPMLMSLQFSAMMSLTSVQKQTCIATAPLGKDKSINP